MTPAILNDGRSIHSSGRSRIWRVRMFAAGAICLLSASALMIGGCREKSPQETAVARIENRVLTMQDIRAQFDTTRPPTEAQIQQYLRRWIADELLYNEAVRRGLNQAPDVVRRMDDMRRQLIIQALLDKEIYDATAVPIDLPSIARYYQDHRAEFTLSETMVLISTALFRDRDKATALRNTVLRGTSWHDAKLEPSMREAILRTRDSVYYVTSQLWPKELWRVATTIKPGTPSFPIGTNDGYYIVFVWAVFLPGTPADLPSVESEIRNRLIVERRQRAYRSLVENLRARYAVETYISPSFGDSTFPARTIPQ